MIIHVIISLTYEVEVMNILDGVLILVIVFGLVGIGYIFIYNKMQYLKTKIEQAEGLIDEALRERYDILVRANDIIKSSLSDKKDYFKEYVELKDKQVSNFEMDRKLKEAFRVLEKLMDDYEELDKNEDLKNITKTIKETDEKIVAATSYYNRHMTELNALVRKFPSNIVGRLHGFKVSTYFDGKDMNDDIYNDFKL